MELFGLNVPNELIYGLAPVIFVTTVGFLTWVVKKITITGTNMEDRMSSVESDVKEIKYMIQRLEPPKET